MRFLWVPEASAIFPGPGQGFPGQFPRVHQGNRLGAGCRENGPRRAFKSLRESLILPLGGGELEPQGWGQRRGCFGEDGSSGIPKGPEDHLLSFARLADGVLGLPDSVLHCTRRCPTEAQTGWQEGWCLNGKNFWFVELETDYRLYLGEKECLSLHYPLCKVISTPPPMPPLHGPHAFLR